MAYWRLRSVIATWSSFAGFIRSPEELFRWGGSHAGLVAHRAVAQRASENT
jgi:hypothetical protein